MKSKKSGFTLVEMIACMAIVAILMAAAGSLLLFSSRVTAGLAGESSHVMIGDAISRLVKEQLEYTDRLKVGEKEQVLAGEVLCFSKDGRLYKDGYDLYGDSFYGNRGVGCRITTDGSQGQTLLIEIYLDDEEGNRLYQNQAGMEFINMKMKNTEIIYQESMISSGIIDSEDQNVYLYYQRDSVGEGL